MIHLTQRGLVAQGSHIVLLEEEEEEEEEEEDHLQLQAEETQMDKATAQS